MAAPKNVVTGFNHNVKHKGRVYHVQTEDAGVESAQLTTHLFVGGNVVASKRTSYADLRGAPNLREVVKALMEEQHKEVLRNLVNGVYDVAEAAQAAAVASWQPGQLSVGQAPRPLIGGIAGAPKPPEIEELAEPEVEVDVSLDAPDDVANVVDPAEGPPHLQVGSGRLAGAMAAGLAQPPAPLPLAKLSQLAPERLGETIFGEDLITEKSLDQVILSYLAGDRDD